MFISIKLKTIIMAIIFIVILLLSFIVFKSVKSANASQKPKEQITVVIDAGHGGIDGGSVGKTTGVTESELNLIFAKNLSNQLNKMNISTVLTRENNGGLYEENAKNLKRSDMKKRKEIIEKVNPRLVVSIHMNSFPLSSSKGAQVFYKKDNLQGKDLAQNIQDQLCSIIDGTRQSAKVGDFYIVNCTSIPAVLIECGFLSNEIEENLLTKKDYQNKVCYSILSGIISYLNQ